MKILVTGGSGFLGSHVADALSDVGHEVTVFDLRDSPFLQSDQKMVVGDILDQDLLERIVAGQDVVYHFAGIADIDECSRRPVDAVRYNILGTGLLLDVCCEQAVERFVFASSAYVYSDHGYFYRTTKKACEGLIEDYHSLYGLKYTCLRYGSLYGERADERNTVYKMIRQALAEGKITYHGTGDEIREFVHVRDAAQSSVKILDRIFENQHVILTGMEKMRYVELLQMVKEMLGNKVEIEMLPSKREAHYKITPYNFSPKLGRKMMINPHIDMGQGLLEYMAEIYAQVHGEKHDEMGLLVNGKE